MQSVPLSAPKITVCRSWSHKYSQGLISEWLWFFLCTVHHPEVSFCQRYLDMHNYHNNTTLEEIWTQSLLEMSWHTIKINRLFQLCWYVAIGEKQHLGLFPQEFMSMHSPLTIALLKMNPLSREKMFSISCMCEMKCRLFNSLSL